MGGCLSAAKEDLNGNGVGNNNITCIDTKNTVSSQPSVKSGHKFGCLNSNLTDKSSISSSDQIYPLFNKSPPKVETSELPVCIALFSYKARTNEDISFQKGDHLEILDASHSDWWVARLKKNAKTGYIPVNYVTKLKPSLTAIWYVGDLSRSDTERRLLSPSNQTGAFLIRDSESRRNDYSLSVRDGDTVKHYRIRQLDEGGFFIARRTTFRTLQELVEHYSRDADGLCVQLCLPCTQVEIPSTPGLSHDTRDHWEIDRASLKFIRKLGHGQFGEVWEGLWNNTTPVAVKLLLQGSMNPRDFLLEASILKQLHHPRLLQLYAVCTRQEPIYIITELMLHGSLNYFLRAPRGKALKLNQLIDMSAQIAAGMAYLESQNYIHRDLAARNVLVGDNNIVKIADFGLARLIKRHEYRDKEAPKLPIKWTAPEAIKHNKFSTKSDVWSFGVLLYEVITYGRPPYPGMSNTEVLAQLDQQYRMPRPDGCPQRLYSVMLLCWHRDPHQRPSFQLLCKQLDQLQLSVSMDAYNRLSDAD